MNNKPWSHAELKSLRDFLSKKQPSESMQTWAKRIASSFKSRTANSIRLKVVGLEEEYLDAPPKILLLDIETLPMEVLVWSLLYNNYIPHDNIVKDWSIVTWSAKWLFDDKVYGEAVSPEDAILREDASLIEGIWKLIDEADIVITQNGKKFDLPKLNVRFLKAGLPPPMYYQVIDTKEVMKKNFGLSSNKLDYATAFLGIETKDDMEFQDWKNCLLGGKVAQKAIAKMLEYNKKDVFIMEELYLRLRPWIKGHPNMNLWSVGEIEVCPNCSSPSLDWKGTYKYPTSTALYRAFRCLRCGAIGHSKKAEYKIKKSKIQ